MQEPAHDPTDLRLRQLLGRIRGEARQTADALVRRIVPIPQRELRKPLLGELLHSMDDALLLASLNDLLLRSRSGHSGCREVVQELALEPGLIAHLPYERVQRLYALTTRHSLLDVRALFLSTRIADREESHTENDSLMLPLGVRKQAARTRDRFLLDRLLRDRNVAVIRNLLQNPRLTEQDLLVIAAMRPTRPEILQAVAEHPRWSSRYRVRKALACNPHTPSAIALSLLTTLMLQDLKFLLGSGVLAPELQSEAERLVALRRRGVAGVAEALPVEAEVDQLLETWQEGESAPAAGVMEEVEEMELSVPTSEAVVAAHLAAERAARDRVLEALKFPADETRPELVAPRDRVVLDEDRAAPEEVEGEVEQLIRDWLILDPSISAEMVALAAFTEVEALPADEAPRVGWPELPTEPPATPAAPAPAEVDPLGRAVARLIYGWQQRDGEISAAFIASAGELTIEVVGDD